MVAEVEVLTAVVVTVNVALELPAATVTLRGTVAAALLLDSDTTMPPVGAAPVKVTVPVEGLPPTTLVGFNDTADNATAGVTVSGAVLFTPL
jgi:hypothetical protein